MPELIRVTVNHGLDQMLDGLDALDPRQIPFVTALALTRTAKAVEKSTRDKMASYIDRPTGRTFRALYTKPATKTDLTAAVLFKGYGDQFSSEAGQYLKPLTEGGTRPEKAFERKLKIAGILGANQYVAPASDYPLDQYGNIPASRYNQILSYLKAAEPYAGFNANRTKASVKRNQKMRQFFAVNGLNERTITQSNMPKGIYERLGHNRIRMVVAFIARPQYRMTYPFYINAQEETQKIFPVQLKEAIEYVAKQPPRGSR